jgi:16S rRNA G1207 methylase RsmC
MTAHYFDPTPGPMAAVESITVTLAGREVSVLTAAGVFSAHRLDLGTSVLLRTLARQDATYGLPDSGNLVDLGCGWGPLALTMGLLAPRATVWAIDVNPNAQQLTARNAERLGLTNITTAGPEVLTDLATNSIDRIWSNPPIRVGKTALHQLLTDWLNALTPDGQAQLVIQRNLGADSLAAWLTNQGWPTTKQASAKGFRVLKVSQSGRDVGGAKPS